MKYWNPKSQRKSNLDPRLDCWIGCWVGVSGDGLLILPDVAVPIEGPSPPPSLE